MSGFVLGILSAGLLAISVIIYGLKRIERELAEADSQYNWDNVTRLNRFHEEFPQLARPPHSPSP